MILGFFFNNFIFTNLHSLTFCNKFIYTLIQDLPLITIEGYLLGIIILFIIGVLLILIYDEKEDIEGIYNTLNLY